MGLKGERHQKKKHKYGRRGSFAKDNVVRTIKARDPRPRHDVRSAVLTNAEVSELMRAYSERAIENAFRSRSPIEEAIAENRTIRTPFQVASDSFFRESPIQKKLRVKKKQDAEPVKGSPFSVDRVKRKIRSA